MVINDAAKLRLISRETEESLMLELRKLRWDIIDSIDAQVSSPGGNGRREGKKEEIIHFSNFTSTEMVPEYPLRETEAQCPRPLLEDDPILCPSFNLGVATRYAQDSKSPEMVQAIFYAMVMNKVSERGITCRISAKCLMWALQLREPRVFHPMNLPADLASSSGPVEVSGTPLWSSCEHSSTPGVLSPEVEVSYPWEITIPNYMTNFQGPEFPGAPTHSDPQDGPGRHFPDPKVTPTLKRTTLEKQYLLPIGYTFVIPKADATMNKSPTKCIVVYRTALNYSLRFPLHPVLEEILNKYELAPAQVLPTSWHNICSFITTYELRGFACSARTFSLVHTIQRAPKETKDLGWYCFNNRPGFIAAIEKKSKMKHWKYDFLFVGETFLTGTSVSLLGTPLGNPRPRKEKRPVISNSTYGTTISPDLNFMAQAIEYVKGPERRKSKSSDREPLNWLPKLKGFRNDFFLTAASLLILKNFSKGIDRPNAPPLVPREKKPAISVLVRKRQRIEGRPDETAASTPTHAGEVGARWSSPQPSGGRSTGDRTPDLQEQAASSKTVGDGSQAVSGSPLSTQQPSTNFIKMKFATKFSLVQELVKSWDLATSGTSNSLKITEEEVTMAGAFAQGVRAAAECRRLEGLATQYQWRWEKLKADQDAREAEKKDLERQLEEALAKAKGGLSQGARLSARPCRYLRVFAQSPGDTAQKFQEDSYFEAYLHYIDERQWSEDKGRNLEEVEYIPPPGEGEGVRDKATNPLDTEASE
ncbi:hypothetical protein Cgig2_021255 [Carnegiea gigantea]|uniref:Uncharacterized protein n=1 Tax=Carnegiea gigantea TaxID=171969 RepID=A0A9Q1Q9F4_9CARY|nr:hypothetical protein Cgig2_021255 [Carnegiea gigantea]